jgi:flagellar biosynthesis/type III secretory pathway chaperone
LQALQEVTVTIGCRNCAENERHAANSLALIEKINAQMKSLKTIIEILRTENSVYRQLLDEHIAYNNKLSAELRSLKGASRPGEKEK